MKLVEISAKNQERYNHFVSQHPLGSIHQTWEWGLFQSKSASRDKFWIFAIEDKNGQILASALVIRQKLPFGKCWLYSPRGPLVDYQNKEIYAPLFGKIAELAHGQNAVFFRFDPALDAVENADLRSLQRPARPAHAHYQPESTLILDLTLSEEQLLAQMKPKGRYNIKIAQKHGVQVGESDNNSRRDVSVFYKLLQQTVTRDQFSGHPISYYQALFDALNPPSRCASADKKNPSQSAIPRAKIYVASYQQNPLAAIIVTYFKDTAIYYFGASGNENRHVMAPYLLQWQAILDAKKAGLHFYDFLGVAPQNQPNHPWAGVTDFKLKFGGKQINYAPAREIIYQPFWYGLIRLAKRLKQK